MKFLKSDIIDYSFIEMKVGELMQVKDPQKLRSHLTYLLEEISYARYQWEMSFAKDDWDHAARILHREKLIIQQLELAKEDSFLLKIQKRDPAYQSNDLKLFYSELIEIFKLLERLIGSSV